MRDLEVVVLEKDEFEALRLADALDLYHEEGAQRMKVSRQTFGLILKSARKKVAQTLIQGAALSIEDFQKKDQFQFRLNFFRYS